jgi:hypothetical protein
MNVRRAVAPLLFLVLLAGAPRLEAASLPFIDMSAFGVELCPQSVCGSAIFVGVLSGRVGRNPSTTGAFAVSITHEPLPGAFESSAITGGVFTLQIGPRTVKGVVTGGTLENLGDNTFAVTITLAPSGGGVLTFEGLLNHNVFPPTVTGRLTTGG